MATAPPCKTTSYDTTLEPPPEYLESVKLIVSSFLSIRYHASPAWKRPICPARGFCDLQGHLERSCTFDYYFNENQILLAVIHRFGLQNDSDAIINWVHDDFLAHPSSILSSHAAKLAEKMTRLVDELEKSMLARGFENNSLAKIHQTLLDNDPRKPTNYVQESTREVEDRDEKKFHQLFVKAGEHAARINTLEYKIFSLLSNASTPLAETSIPGRAEKEQESSGSPGEDSEMSSVGTLTPNYTVRSSSLVSTPRPRWSTVILSVKGHYTNMLVEIGLDTPFKSLRQNLSRSRLGIVELWHGNTQIMNKDTPNTLGLEEGSLINVVHHPHRINWIDESRMHFRNTFAV